MLAPQQAAAAGLGPRARTGSLVVLSSPALKVDSERTLDSAPVTLGRSSDNDMELGDDDFASAHHARVEPRRDGVWVAGRRLDERHLRERDEARRPEEAGSRAT